MDLQRHGKRGLQHGVEDALNPLLHLLLQVSLFRCDRRHQRRACLPRQRVQIIYPFKIDLHGGHGRHLQGSPCSLRSRPRRRAGNAMLVVVGKELPRGSLGRRATLALRDHLRRRVQDVRELLVQDIALVKHANVQAEPAVVVVQVQDVQLQNGRMEHVHEGRVGRSLQAVRLRLVPRVVLGTASLQHKVLALQKIATEVLDPVALLLDEVRRDARHESERFEQLLAAARHAVGMLEHELLDGQQHVVAGDHVHLGRAVHASFGEILINQRPTRGFILIASRWPLHLLVRHQMLPGNDVQHPRKVGQVGVARRIRHVAPAGLGQNGQPLRPA
eukprot:scaffold1809_cov228-Pinguiococcus_pyrenoidosus.AAC.11